MLYIYIIFFLYLNSSVCDFADFPGVENFPMLMMKRLVEPPCGLRGRHVHKSISHIALVAVFNFNTQKEKSQPHDPTLIRIKIHDQNKI